MTTRVRKPLIVSRRSASPSPAATTREDDTSTLQPRIRARARPRDRTKSPEGSKSRGHSQSEDRGQDVSEPNERPSPEGLSVQPSSTEVSTPTETGPAHTPAPTTRVKVRRTVPPKAGTVKPRPRVNSPVNYQGKSAYPYSGTGTMRALTDEAKLPPSPERNDEPVPFKLPDGTEVLDHSPLLVLRGRECMVDEDDEDDEVVIGPSGVLAATLGDLVKIRDIKMRIRMAVKYGINLPADLQGNESELYERLMANRADLAVSVPAEDKSDDDDSVEEDDDVLGPIPIIGSTRPLDGVVTPPIPSVTVFTPIISSHDTLLPDQPADSSPEQVEPHDNQPPATLTERDIISPILSSRGMNESIVRRRSTSGNAGRRDAPLQGRQARGTIKSRKELEREREALMEQATASVDDPEPVPIVPPTPFRVPTIGSFGVDELYAADGVDIIEEVDEVEGAIEESDSPSLPPTIVPGGRVPPPHVPPQPRRPAPGFSDGFLVRDMSDTLRRSLIAIPYDVSEERLGQETLFWLAIECTITSVIDLSRSSPYTMRLVESDAFWCYRYSLATMRTPTLSIPKTLHHSFRSWRALVARMTNQSYVRMTADAMRCEPVLWRVPPDPDSSQDDEVPPVWDDEANGPPPLDLVVEVCPHPTLRSDPLVTYLGQLSTGEWVTFTSPHSGSTLAALRTLSHHDYIDHSGMAPHPSYASVAGKLLFRNWDKLDLIAMRVISHGRFYMEGVDLPTSLGASMGGSPRQSDDDAVTELVPTYLIGML